MLAVRAWLAFSAARAGAAVSEARQRRDHRPLPRRHVGGHHRAPARAGHGEAPRRERGRRQSSRRRRRDRLQARRQPEARRLQPRLEFELDLDHLPFGPARLRLPRVRSGGARAGRVAGARGARRCALEDAGGLPEGRESRGPGRSRSPTRASAAIRTSRRRALPEPPASRCSTCRTAAAQIVPNVSAATSMRWCSCPARSRRTCRGHRAHPRGGDAAARSHAARCADRAGAGRRRRARSVARHRGAERHAARGHRALESAIRSDRREPRSSCKGSEKLNVRPAFMPAAEFGELIAKEDAQLARIMQAIGLKK